MGGPQGDSLGGLLECRVQGLPAGWGEPLLDPLDGRLAQQLFCIPGIRGFELGAGFGLASMRGSEANDTLLDATGLTATNHSGGISGGISNGNELVFRVVSRPTPSIEKPQTSLDLHSGEQVQLSARGRNDACFALRLPVVLEAATAVVLADFALLAKATAPQLS